MWLTSDTQKLCTDQVARAQTDNIFSLTLCVLYIVLTQQDHIKVQGFELNHSRHPREWETTSELAILTGYDFAIVYANYYISFAKRVDTRVDFDIDYATRHFKFSDRENVFRPCVVRNVQFSKHSKIKPTPDRRFLTFRVWSIRTFLFRIAPHGAPGRANFSNWWPFLAVTDSLQMDRRGGEIYRRTSAFRRLAILTAPEWSIRIWIWIWRDCLWSEIV